MYREHALGEFTDSDGDTTTLISALTPHLSEAQSGQLENAILALEPYYKGAVDQRPPEERRNYAKWTREARVRLLVAFAPDQLSLKTRALVASEKRALPRALDHEVVMQGGTVESPMSVDQMSSARPEHIISLFEDANSQTKCNDPAASRLDDPGAAGAGGGREAAMRKSYRQLDAEERVQIATLRSQGYALTKIAEALGRHRTTIWREVKRNRAPHDGGYRSARAHERAVARRKRSRRNRRFGPAQMSRVEALLRQQWSPEQVAGYLRGQGEFSISHETIYRHVWRDLRRGGSLHMQMRGARKQRRKRYGRYDSRGRLAGKRHISERPAAVETRQEPGHWEIDTVLGTTSDCVVTLVERQSGCLLLGKMRARTTAELNRATFALMCRHPDKFQTITSDNGTEFHDYKSLEAATGVPFYFATPHHSWERGTNENTNGLLRQYLPKGTSLASLTQRRCDAIAETLNARPRKRHAYKTPKACFNVALQN